MIESSSFGKTLILLSPSYRRKPNLFRSSWSFLMKEILFWREAWWKNWPMLKLRELCCFPHCQDLNGLIFKSSLSNHFRITRLNMLMSVQSSQREAKTLAPKLMSCKISQKRSSSFPQTELIDKQSSSMDPAEFTNNVQDGHEMKTSLMSKHLWRMIQKLF